MCRKSSLAVLLFLASAVSSAIAQDVVTVGTASGPAGSLLTVPVSIRDVSGTALGVDAGAGNRIQGFAFKVTFPSEVIESISFTRGGITTPLTAMYETTYQGSDYSSCIASFNEGTNPVPFVSNAAAPGNPIGALNVRLRATALVTSTAILTIHPPSAILSNQAGTVRETVALGTLSLVNGQVSVTVTDPVPAPTALMATAVSTSQVDLTWSATGGPDHYEVFRSQNGSAFSFLSLAPAMSFSDSTVIAGTTYVYEVRAVDAGNVVSSFSNVDPATTSFTDDPLVVNTTLVKAVHPLEVTTAINALRSLAGLPLFADATIASGLVVRADHINNLRTALNEARTTLGLSAVTFAESVTVGTTTIKAAHVEELRSGVK
ncbi:MAG: hypothetical protein ACXVIJ_06425 [Thermoanaerobaculia bacterium]